MYGKPSREDFLPGACEDYAARCSGSDLDKAKQMLREEFVKQPLLTVFFTAEPWRAAMIGLLVEAGYLRAPDYWDGKPLLSNWPLDLPLPYEITLQAQTELNHVSSFYSGPAGGPVPAVDR